MKYKAIATIVLLLCGLIPLVPLAVVPQAAANQPNFNVEFRIRPNETKYWGPCVVSTDFTKDVYLWNDKTLTGVGVYAFDMWVYWQNNQGISLTDFTNHIPWASGKYFLITNATGPSIFPNWDFYHIAVTAVGNSTIDPSLELGATGLFNASIVTLNFHIDKEPCWPYLYQTEIQIGGAAGGYPYDVPIVSTGCGKNITNLEIDNGWYFLYSSQPNIDPLVAADDPGRVNDHIFKEDSIGETHTIVIALSNITGAYGFEFTLSWEPLWYNASIQHVTILPAFAPPYELLTMVMNEQAGTLYVKLVKPCEKPGVHAAGFTPVVSVSFVTTNLPEIELVPIADNTTFALTGAKLYAKCVEGTRTYDQGLGNGWNTLLYSGDIIQMFVPKSEADITIDGVVDIEDLAALAGEYGKVHAWSGLAAPVAPAPVDIFDLVYVAKRYGDP